MELNTTPRSLYFRCLADKRLSQQRALGRQWCELVEHTHNDPSPHTRRQLWAIKWGQYHSVRMIACHTKSEVAVGWTNRWLVAFTIRHWYCVMSSHRCVGANGYNPIRNGLILTIIWDDTEVWIVPFSTLSPSLHL